MAKEEYERPEICELAHDDPRARRLRLAGGAAAQFMTHPEGDDKGPELALRGER